MRKELRAKILVYNRSVKAKGKKAEDMDILIAALAKLPPGQLKKVLTDEVKAILRKYGINFD